MFKASKYKHTVGQEWKRESWYPDLRISTNAPAEATTVACSGSYIAVNWMTTAGATIGLLDIAETGKRKVKGEPPLIRAHNGALYDMSFSPFDDFLLGTASEDSTVKLWSLPRTIEECYSSASLRSPAVTLQGHKKRVDSLAWNPTAAGIIATSSSDKSVKVWNAETKQQVFSTAPEVFPEIAWSASWNYEGSLIACTSRDRKIRIIDPRASDNVVVQMCQGHEGIKQSRVCWAGRNARLLTTGFDRTNMRQFAFWDARNLGKPLALKNMGSSSGVSIPLYDGDTNLFFITSKGEGVVRAYEATDAAPWFTEINSVSSDQIAKGACLVPKTSLSLLANEIDLVLKLGSNAVIPVGFYTPRARRIFHQDLYPDTPSKTPALTAADWLAGQTKEPVLMQLKPPSDDGDSAIEIAEPEPATAATTTTTTRAATSSTSSPAPAAKKTSTASPAPRGGSTSPAPAAASSSSPAPAHKVPQVVRYTKFRHIAGKPFMRNTFLEEVRINPNCGRLVCANEALIALPWAGPGGRMVVLPMSRPGGRVGTDTPFLEHGSEIVDVAWDPFDAQRLATAGEDAHIRLWDVPLNGLGVNTKECSVDLAGHNRRLHAIAFNNSAAGILASAAADGLCKIWDIGAEATAFEAEGLHRDVVINMAWNWDGSLLATACKDTRLRILDPRAPAGFAAVAETVAHEGAKGFKVTWAGRHERLVTAGFSKTSERVLSLWDQRNLAKPLASRVLDSQFGVLTPHYDADTDVIAVNGRGDGNVRFFEVTDAKPFLHLLTEYQSTSPFADIDFLPKASVDVRACEIMRVIRVTGSPPSTVERIQFTVPRTRMEFFQDDIFPPTRSNEPAATAEEWIAGKKCEIKTVSMQPEGMEKLSEAPPVDHGQSKYHMPTEEERAAGRTLSRDDMFNRFYQQMQTKKDETVEEEEARKKREEEANSGDCVADDEWD